MTWTGHSLKRSPLARWITLTFNPKEEAQRIANLKANGYDEDGVDTATMRESFGWWEMHPNGNFTFHPKES